MGVLPDLRVPVQSSRGRGATWILHCDSYNSRVFGLRLDVSMWCLKKRGEGHLPEVRVVIGPEVLAPLDLTREPLRVWTSPEGLRSVDGARACFREPAACDLSGAIEVDGSDVTFTLTRPDPDLLYKMALPLASVVPSTTPAEEVPQVPATGPYMIEPGGTGDDLELIRNEAFEEWSPAAQPDGFVDRISIRFGQEVDTSFDQVIAGDIDLMLDQPTPQDLEALLTLHPEQAVVTVQPITFDIGFDVKKEPFDDERVRRAVNLAIDRAHIVDLIGGLRVARTTCQILPPGLQGYAAFCPHTLEPDGAVWTDPDPARAGALIAEADAAGTAVTVWSPNPSDLAGGQDVMRYLTDVLNDLGLRATLEFVPFGRYVRALFDRGPGPGTGGYPHAFNSGWLSAYPRASDFLEPQFRCDGFSNTSGYCDPDLDARMDHARSLETTDPGDATREWTAIEHRLVEEAVQAPFANLVSTYSVSSEVGNAQVHIKWGVLLSRIWVR